MAQNQNSGAIPSVTMDSRKFMSALNDSAQVKVAFFEDRVQKLGAEAHKRWRLAALHPKELYIEDLDTHVYFVAEHNRDQTKVNITNIRPVQIIEGEKQGLFQESAFRLINAIEANDQKEMATAFNQLKGHRFSSRVVPTSGVVFSRDGMPHHVALTTPNALGEDVRDRLIAAIVEGLKDKIVVEDGHVVGGIFDEEEVKLPVTKWAARKLIARRMLESAKQAYWSKGFQARIYSIAKLVSEGKIPEAVEHISPFLTEMEEFTLLTRVQTKTLIENALAAKAVFNQQLCDDTATLFYRTNLRLNKSKVVDEWRNIAKAAEHPVLAENVGVLEKAQNFETTYDKFLTLIFETISNREVAAEALATTLGVLRNKTPKIRESHELSSKLNGLINRLKQRDFDDAAIYEAEDLIATIQEELGATETLGNFDQMPGDTAGLSGSTNPAAQGGIPPIIINSPLIQIGGSSGAPPAGGAAATPPPPPGEGGDGDPELEALLGGGGAGGQQQQPPPPPPPPPGGGAAPPPTGQPLMQSKDRNGRAIAEGVPQALAGRGSPKDRPYRDDHPSEYEGLAHLHAPDEDDDDPYAVKKTEQVATEGLRITDYGAPVITDEGDLDRIITLMQRLATEHRLVGAALSENLANMAKASIKAIGLRIPEGKMPKALEQVITAFSEEWEKPWLKDKDKDKDGDDSEDDDEENVAEDQFKVPVRRPRGFARSNLGREAGKTGRASSEGRRSAPVVEDISWGQQQDDAILGQYAGVNFIFDHGGNSELEPAVLSEDGAVEIPIPADLREDAFAAAAMTEGDGRRFVMWLDSHIEQLRPIQDEESLAIDEAVAKITAGPDGTLSVEVSPDVEVGEVDDGGGMTDDGMGAAADGMAPVDATEPAAAGPTEPAAGVEPSEPDFEAPQQTMGQNPATEPAAGPVKPAAKPMKPAQPAEDDGIHFEDKDITAPPNAKYTTHVKDNKRKMPEVRMPGKTNDKLDSIGPDLKVDDGSGTNPPTAKKGSDD